MPRSVSASYKYSAQVTGTVVNVEAANSVVLMALVLYNTTAAVAYLQVFLKPAASVTLGTTAPDLVFPLPANGGLTLNLSEGWFVGGNGFSIAGTTTRTGSTGAAIDVVLAYQQERAA